MEKEPRIRLLTYNVFMRPPGINTHDDDFKDDRLSYLKKHIGDYDIVCFQQLFSTGNFRRERMIQFGINNDFYFWEVCSPPSFFSGPLVDAGLVIISRFPILKTRFESYGIGILSDSASDKGYLYCKINVNGHILHLFNTHLQATYNNIQDNDPEKRLTIITRLHQLEQLTKKIQQIVEEQIVHPEGELILIAGDLNADARKIYSQMDFTDSHNFVQKHDIKHGEKFDEYSLMMKILSNSGKNKVIDHLFANHSEHPPTYGHEQTIFTSPDDLNSHQRLDYIIQLVREKDNMRLHPMTQSCVIQKFVAHEQVFTHLSDHYGVSIDFKIRTSPLVL